MVIFSGRVCQQIKQPVLKKKGCFFYFEAIVYSIAFSAAFGILSALSYPDDSQTYDINNYQDYRPDNYLVEVPQPKNYIPQMPQVKDYINNYSQPVYNTQFQNELSSKLKQNDFLSQNNRPLDRDNPSNILMKYQLLIGNDNPENTIKKYYIDNQIKNVPVLRETLKRDNFPSALKMLIEKSGRLP